MHCCFSLSTWMVRLAVVICGLLVLPANTVPRSSWATPQGATEHAVNTTIMQLPCQVLKRLLFAFMQRFLGRSSSACPTLAQHVYLDDAVGSFSTLIGTRSCICMSLCCFPRGMWYVALKLPSNRMLGHTRDVAQGMCGWV